MRRNEREVKDQNEILKIAEQAVICHIALHDIPAPYVVPLNFGIDLGEPVKLYFHCAREGKKLELIKKDPRTGFQMETHSCLIKGQMACDFTMQYKSIIGKGTIRIVVDEVEKRYGLSLLMKHYTNLYFNNFDDKLMTHTLVLCLEVEEWFAKQHGVINE